MLKGGVVTVERCSAMWSHVFLMICFVVEVQIEKSDGKIAPDSYVASL